MLEIGTAGTEAEGEGPERGTLESQSSACNGERNHPRRSPGLYPEEGFASSRTTAPSTSSSSPSSPPPSPQDGNNNHTRVGGGDNEASRSDSESCAKKRKLVEDDGRRTEPHHHLLEGERGGRPFLFSSSAGLSSLPSSSYTSCSVSHGLGSPPSFFPASPSSPSHISCSSSSPSPQPALALVSCSYRTPSSDVSRGKNLSELSLDPGPEAFLSDSPPFFMSVFFTSQVKNSCSSPPYHLLSLLLEYLPLSSLLFSLLPCSRSIFQITSDIFAESKGRLPSLSKASCPFFCPPSSLAASSRSSPVSSNSTIPVDPQGEKPPQQISFSQKSEETSNSDSKTFTTQMPKSIGSSWRVHSSDRKGYHQLCEKPSSFIRIPITSSDRHSTPVSFLLASVTPHRSRRKLLLSKLVIRPSELSLLHAKVLPFLLYQGHGVFPKGGHTSTLEAKEASRQQRKVRSEERSPASPSTYTSANPQVPCLSSVFDRPGVSPPSDAVADVPSKRFWELELSCLSVQHWKRLKRKQQHMHSADGRAVNEDEAETPVSFSRVFFLDNLVGLRLSNSEVNRHAAKVLRGCLLQGLLAEQSKRPNRHADSNNGGNTLVGDREGHNTEEREDIEEEKELEREQKTARDSQSPFISSSPTSPDNEDGSHKATFTHSSRDSAIASSSGTFQSSPHSVFLPSSCSPASTGCKDTSLQSIAFSRCGISSAAFHSFCVLTLPLLHSRLRSLHLVDCRLTAADAPFLGYALLHLPLVEELNLSNNLLGEEGGLILLLALLFNSFHRSRQLEHPSVRFRQYPDISRGRVKDCGTLSPPGSRSGSPKRTSEDLCVPSRSHQELPHSFSSCPSSQSPGINNCLKETREGNDVVSPPSEDSSLESSVEHMRLKRNHELFSFSGSDVSLCPLSSTSSSSSSEHASLQDTSVTRSNSQLQNKKDERSNSSAFFPFHPTVNETGHHDISSLSHQSPSILSVTHPQGKHQVENLLRHSRSPAGRLSSLSLSGNDLSGDNRLFLAILTHFISTGSPPLQHLDLANNGFQLETLLILSDALKQKKTRLEEPGRMRGPASGMTRAGGGTERNGQRSVRETVRFFAGDQEQTQKENKMMVREQGPSEKDGSVPQNHHSNKEAYRSNAYNSEDHCLFSEEQYMEIEDESFNLLIDLRENFCMCNRSSSGGGEDLGDAHTRQLRGCIVPLESSIIEEFRQSQMRERERIEERRASRVPLRGLQTFFSGSEISLKKSNEEAHAGKAVDLFLEPTSHSEGERRGKASSSSTATTRRAIEMSEGLCERQREDSRTHPMEGGSSTQQQDGCGDKGTETERENSFSSLVPGKHQTRGEGWQASSERFFVCLDECECALARARGEVEKKEKERSLKDYHDALEDTQKYQLAELLKNDRGFADRVLDLCEARQDRHPGDNRRGLHRRGREQKAREREADTEHEETLEEAAGSCGTDLEVQESAEEEDEVRGRRELRSRKIRKEDEDEIVEKRETLSTRLIGNRTGVWKENEGKEEEEDGQNRHRVTRVEDVQEDDLTRTPALDLSINGIASFPSSSSSSSSFESSSFSSLSASSSSSFPHGRLVGQPNLSYLDGGDSMGAHLVSRTPLCPASSLSSSLVDPSPTSSSCPSVLLSGSSTTQTNDSLNLVPCSQAASTASHAAQSSSDGGENEGQETEEEEEEETEGSVEDEEEEDEEEDDEEDVEDEDDEEDGDERCFFFRGRNVKAPASVLLRKKVSRLQKLLQQAGRDQGNEEGENEVSHGLVQDQERYACLHRGHSDVNLKKEKDEKEDGQQTKASTTSSEAGVRTHHDEELKKEQVVCSRVEEKVRVTSEQDDMHHQERRNVTAAKDFIDEGRLMEHEERRQETDALPTPRLKRERTDNGEEEDDDEDIKRKEGDGGSTHRKDHHEDVKYTKKEVQPCIPADAGGLPQAAQQEEDEDESYNEESDAEDDTYSDSSGSGSDDGEEEEDLDEEELMDLIKDATSDDFFSPFSSSSSSACKRRRGL